MIKTQPEEVVKIRQLTWYTTAKFVRKFGNEIVVDTIF